MFTITKLLTYFPRLETKRLLLLSFLFCVLLFIMGIQQSRTNNVDGKEVTDIITKFSIKFCNEIYSNKSVVSSPLSAEMLLSLLALGSTDPAHSELLTALSMPDDDSIRKSFLAISENIKSVKAVTLNMANKIYAYEGPFEVVKSLENDAVKIFNASIEKVNFNSNVAAAELINKWLTASGQRNTKGNYVACQDRIQLSFNMRTSGIAVPMDIVVGGSALLSSIQELAAKRSTKILAFPFAVMKATNGHIKDFIPSDSIGSDTRLVLVNALYFKGTWKTKFDPTFTRDVEFHLNLKSSVEIPMMYVEEHFLYGESKELDAKFLDMPYKGDEASMLIVLPNQIEGLRLVLQKLTAGFDLMAVVKKMSSTKVQVFLPKFKIETETDLKSLLLKFGINAIFDRTNSGLTKLFNNNDKLFVSTAIQKAFIEVNEDGAEATAATGLVVMLRSGRPLQLSFRADHPFLYVLRESNNVTLFIGYFVG